MLHLHSYSGPVADWVRSMLARRHSNMVTCALANKLARIAWAIASRDAVFELPTRAPVHKRPAFLLTYRSQPIWFCDC
jgi:hypothetical protein